VTPIHQCCLDPRAGPSVSPGIQDTLHGGMVMSECVTTPMPNMSADISSSAHQPYIHTSVGREMRWCTSSAMDSVGDGDHKRWPMTNFASQASLHIVLEQHHAKAGLQPRTTPHPCKSHSMLAAGSSSSRAQVRPEHAWATPPMPHYRRSRLPRRNIAPTLPSSTSSHLHRISRDRLA
jgi:hypothetical protein